MDWVKVGVAVREARLRRYGLQRDFARATGISPRTLSDLENGARSSYAPHTMAAVEDALGWEPGAIEVLARGGRVRPADDPQLARVLAGWPHLSPDVRRAVVAAVEAARR